MRMMDVMRMRGVPSVVVRAGKGRGGHGSEKKREEKNLLHGSNVTWAAGGWDGMRGAYQVGQGGQVSQVGQASASL